MLYRLSKLVPVPMRSTYKHGRFTSDGPIETHRERSTWWQWRSRIYRMRTTTLA